MNELSEIEVGSVQGGAASSEARRRLRLMIGLLVGWSLLFLPNWLAWVDVALSADLHSHILLIPAVTIYLLMTVGKPLAGGTTSSPAAGAPLVLLGLACWAGFLWLAPPWSKVDGVAFGVVAWLLGLWGVALAALGWERVKTVFFPLAFLVFMIPLPGWLETGMERFLMVLSARLSELVFQLGGIPVFRNGQVLELPGIVLEVAQECSGIRSTWVLFITSVIAAHLFLPTTKRRVILVAAVIPLGILRNAVRIYVIGWLCVNYGPEQIDHWLHRKGGPLFFAGSLAPLFLLAWCLRRGGKAERGERVESGSATMS